MHKKKFKALFICKNRDQYGSDSHIGSNYGLINSAKLLSDYIRSTGNHSDVDVAIDGNNIDALIHKHNPTHVFIEVLWVTPKKLEELLILHHHRNFIVRVHSKLPFLAHEGIAIEWIKSYLGLSLMYNNVFVAPNTKELTNDLRNILKWTSVIMFLPNIYLRDESCGHSRNDKEFINIGCFGSIRPLKNQLVQAAAGIMFANHKGSKLNFFMNKRIEQGGEGVLKNITNLFKDPHHKLILIDWLPHNEFVKFIGHMDYGMQVSLSESFNIVTADFVSAGVPIVVSEDIDWMPSSSSVKINSVIDIYKELLYVSRHKRCVIRTAKRYLKRYNKIACSVWDETFDLA